MEIRIPANKPFFPEQQRAKISQEISHILAGGRLTMGPWIKKFEDAFAKYTGSKYAIAVNSGTSALEILLRFFNVKNKEVIVPTNTFLSTANAVIFAGGKPVLADISAETLCIDPNEIKRKMTAQTRGVIVVHIAGLICPQINEIRDLCIENGLFLIEDAAHAPGASIDSTKAGALADGGAFSFYPTKPMTTGEGGMITTNNPDCDHFSRSVRSHGIAVGEETNQNKGLLVRLGYNWRMSELQAVTGYFQLKNLDEAILRRNQVADTYRRELSNIPGISMFKVPENIRHSYYKFPVSLNEGINRQKVVEALRQDHGIQAGSIYLPPCHLQPFYKNHFGYKMGDHPVAEDILSRTIALPIFPEMKEEDGCLIRDAFAEILKNFNRIKASSAYSK